MINNRENGSNLPINLYNQFAKTSGKIIRDALPVQITTIVNLAVLVGVNLVGDDIIKGQYYGSGLAIGGVAEVISAIWSRRRSQQHFKTLQNIAIQIAEAEGRNPQEPKTEAGYITKIASLRAVLTPPIITMPSPSKSLSQSQRSLETNNIKRITKLYFFAFDKQSKQFRKDGLLGGKICTTALALSEYDWDAIAKDIMRPQHSRRLAYLMTSEVNKRLRQIDQEKFPNMSISQ